jgi:uncharacterized protein (TIGR03437 family)
MNLLRRMETAGRGLITIGKALGSRNVAGLVLIARLLAPFAWAQSTIPLTPLNPVVGTDAATLALYHIAVTTAAGSITVTSTDVNRPGSATVSITAPSTITTIGAPANGNDVVSPPAQFTVNQKFTGITNGLISVYYDTNTPGHGFVGCSINANNAPPSTTCGGVTNMIDGGPSTVSLAVAIQGQLPASFGDTFGVVANFEWSFTPSTLSPLKIDHVEVVQSIQTDADNTAVPLIAGKSVLVRVFFVTTDGESAGAISGTLNGYDDFETTHAGPTVFPRDGWYSSLNFELRNPPAGSFHLSIDAHDYVPIGTGPSPYTAHTEKDVQFYTNASAPAEFYVGLLPLCVDLGQSCPKSALIFDDIAGAAFPFPDGVMRFYEIPVPAPPVFSAVVGPNQIPFDYPYFDFKLSRLLYKIFVVFNIYDLSLIPRMDHLAAWTGPIYRAGGDIAWYEKLAFHGTPSQISWQPRFGIADDIFRLAHRLGHQFGLTDHVGDVGEVGWDSSSGIPGVSRYFDNGIVPTDTPNLMDPAPGRWITPADYQTLFQKAPVAQPARIEHAVPQAAGTSEYVVVSGTVQRDSSGAQFDPVYHVTTAHSQPPSQPGGNHCLQFSNAGGLLGQYCFNLDVSATGIAGLDQQFFTVVAPWPAGTTKLSLVRGGALLTSATAAQDPVVTILSPKSGDRWQGSNTITWSVSGAAPDVVFAVLYSADGGNTWLPMATDITDKQYAFDTSQIMGGAQVFFRVIAATGLNSGTATVGPLTVTQTPKIGAAAPTLDFGNILLGQSATGSIGITSSGSGPLTISGISVDNPAFTVTSQTPPYPILVGRQFTVTVNLLAPASGNQSGTLTIRSNDPVTPVFTVPLSAQVSTTPQTSIFAGQAPLDFGTVPMGQTGEAVLSLTNGGSADLNVTSFRSSDPQFTVAGPSTPLTVSSQAGQDVILRFSPSSTGLRTATITISSNDPTHASFPVAIRGTGASASATSPQITSGSVGNAASYTPKLARGGLAVLFGSNLLPGSTAAQAPSAPFPFSVAGVSVAVNGIPAPIFFVNATQMDFQTPADVPPGSFASVVVTVNGVASPAVVVPIADYGVGVFTYARTATAIDPIIVHGASNQLVTPSNPATPNEVLVVYATGIGKLTNAPGTDVGAPAPQYAMAVDTPTVTVAGAPAGVLFAGLTPTYVGLVQLNIQLPATLPSGSLPLVIQFPGDSTPVVNLAVQGNTTALPKLGLSASSLPFGNVTVGQFKELSVTVSNTGSAALSVSSVTVTGAGFSRTTAASFSVPPGGPPQTVTVRYTPASATASNGTLTLVSNDANSPASIVLSGAGVAAVAPIISVSPPSADFLSVPAGQTKDIVLTVNNSGNKVLTVNSVTGSNPRFAMVITSPPFLVTTLPAFDVGFGSYQYVTIRFSPTAAGAQSGTLTFASTDPATPSLTVNLSGTGTGAATPVISVSPTTLDFGSVNTNANKAITLTVSNTGGGTLSLTAFNITNSLFSLVSPPTLPVTVPAAGLPLSVRFAPVAAVAQTGTLTITSNDPDPTRGKLNVALTGTGVTPVAVCFTPPANQVSWWRGDGNANDSAGANNGTIQGGTTFAAGEVGQAFQFDGSTGYVSAGNPANLQITSAITIETWINPRTAPTGTNLAAIVTKWAQSFADVADSDAYGLWLVPGSGGLNLFSAIHQSGGREPHPQGGIIPLNAWTHVAMTFDAASGQYVLYVNGQAVSSATSTGAIQATNHNVFIGREDSFLPRPFNGLIDEAAIYNRALSAAEILSIFNAGSAGKCKSGTGGGVAGVPSRPVGSVLDSSNPLSTNLAGLFLMNEGKGSTDQNLVDGQQASFAGAAIPTWNTSDPSITFNGGGYLNSYLNAGTDLIFDKLPTSQFTIVAKVFVNALTAAGIAEKNDQNAADGFLFGFDQNGALHLTVEKSGQDMRVISTGGAVAAGQWAQLAVTWDGSVATAAVAHVYVNGTELAKPTAIDGVGTLTYASATNQPFRIGDASFDGMTALNGKMAYLAVYKGRILTVAEMNSLDARLPIK